jgi:putative Mg2+ transporter-C (MgtC) family protein
MLLNQYIDHMLVAVWQINQTTDAARLGAQVINGIGFLGAGGIIMTGSQQVKGLTTAAGLWASACMGLAIGAGFFECALMAFAAIIMSTTLLDKVEKLITSRSRNMNINVIVTETAVIHDVHDVLRGMDLKIFDSEITNVRELASESPNVVIETQLAKRRPHVEIIAALAAIEGVISVEEL